MNSFYSKEELIELGFKRVGENVLISRKCSIYGTEKIEIGNHVRVDDFCILSGRIVLGDYIHISAYTGLYGGEKGIFVEDFVTISGNNLVYAVTDDYSGRAMTNPMVADKYRNVQEESVIFRKYSILGCSSVVLPGVEISEGASFGSMSFVSKNPEPWSVNVGVPFRKIKEREKNILQLAEQFVHEECN